MYRSATCAVAFFILLYFYLLFALVIGQEEFIPVGPAEDDEQGEQEGTEFTQEQLVNQLEQTFLPGQEIRQQSQKEMFQNMMPWLPPAMVEYDDKYKGRFINAGWGKIYLSCRKCPSRGR